MTSSKLLLTLFGKTTLWYGLKFGEIKKRKRNNYNDNGISGFGLLNLPGFSRVALESILSEHTSSSYRIFQSHKVI